MLNYLCLENFKSWRKAEINFAPITALFGANSSGKSSLLQFLLLLKQTKDSADRSLALDFGGPDSSADLGSFRDAVYLHNEEAAISWRLRWELQDELRIADPSGKRSEILFKGTELGVSSAVRLRNQIAVGDSLAYDFSGARFSLDRASGKAGFQLHIEPEGEFRFTRCLVPAFDGLDLG